MNRVATKLCLVFCLGLILAAGFTQPAFARRSRGYSAAAAKARKAAAIKAAQAQYASALSVMNAAQASGNSASMQLQQIIDHMTRASQEMREAVSDVKDFRKDLIATEEDILQEQSADSEYVKVMTELTEVKGKMAAAEKRILSSTTYVTARDHMQAGEGATGVAKLRHEMLESDREYAMLKQTANSLTTDVTRIRHALFEADTEWKTIHEHLVKAQREAEKREAEVYAAAPDRGQPIAQIKDAKQALSYASAVKAQAEATLKSLGASTSAKPTSSSKAR